MGIQLSPAQINRIRAEVDASAAAGNYAGAYSALRDAIQPRPSLNDLHGAELPRAGENFFKPENFANGPTLNDIKERH